MTELFASTPGARIFGLPPGADFPQALIDGLVERACGDPTLLGRTEIFVNTQRMRRRLRDLFDAGPARLVPRLRLVTELGPATPLPDAAAAVSPLRRKLELGRLIRGLIEADPTLAPRRAAFDLADSLIALLDEMQGEGLAPDALAALNIVDASGHWQRSLDFINIVQRYFDNAAAPDTEARQRRAVEQIAKNWEEAPPTHPVIVAGSTGSRGATALFMAAVAKLPQGAVVLPGFDFTMSGDHWGDLLHATGAEDHPQYRFARFLDQVNLPPAQVVAWQADRRDARNRVVSLALRPAPFTHHWLRDGPSLGDLTDAMAGVDLLEAPTPRTEALSIALRLRQAVEDGVVAALISPDRTLTRRVAAALDRWGIEPDDSAGRPLDLSPPGRFLRQIMALTQQKTTVEGLIALLKHPLCASGADRGDHLRMTRDLELSLRNRGPAFPDKASLDRWAIDRPERQAWADRISVALDEVADAEAPLADHLTHLIHCAETLARGADAVGSGDLWGAEAGKAARQALTDLLAESDAAGPISGQDFADILGAVLAAIDVRDPVRSHSGVMIWGTLEARVQGADLVILGGLNEGTWPSTPAPDPWLNRAMRAEAGLLLPERRIGLSAHDFQQAIAAPSVVLSRARRTTDAEAVPARWVARLTSLLDGLAESGGSEALASMRMRGNHWCDMAAALDADLETQRLAHRPSPKPPVEHRPRQLSATQIQTLIRDPYAIYARHILDLKPLNPLRPSPDARFRGSVLHKVFERFIDQGVPTDPATARDALMIAARTVLADEVPWPVARSLWLARIARAAGWFIETELARQSDILDSTTEVTGHLDLADPEFHLVAKADRIDRLRDGTLAIYDYKSSPPSARQISAFDKQLLLECLIVRWGAFKGIAPATVSLASYIGLGATQKTVSVSPEEGELAQGLADLKTLIAAYCDPGKGYLALRAMEDVSYTGDYNHLARFGEWSLGEGSGE
ncbi:MAG: double-strand break repair protein AddB [Rhodobacteraceae bacterium]|nr:double-strand break repair protein AddB [Paracoccaceae bacterium]